MAITTYLKAKAVGAKINGSEQGSIFHGFDTEFMGEKVAKEYFITIIFSVNGKLCVENMTNK
jgi:hypothetical protein